METQTNPAIAEHSMCHPGRPGPQGDSHEGSPSLDFFHSAKSFGDLLSTDALANAPSPSAIKVLSPYEDDLKIVCIPRDWGTTLRSNVLFQMMWYQNKPIH